MIPDDPDTYGLLTLPTFSDLTRVLTMFPLERALLIINRTSGIGQGESSAPALTSLFRKGLAEISKVEAVSVDDHAAARACAAGFLSASSAPALVVAGGGGGTLRAVIEAVCESRSVQRACVGALRMGSGNVLAKHFGVPADPITALEGLLINLKARRTASCCVMRCETWTSSGNSVIHHAVTLGGLGQFGRVPSDLARWHATFPFLQKSAARLFGVENLTNLEYGAALLLRSICCMLFPRRMELVEVEFVGEKQRFRLLSGVLMNFPIRSLPFKPAVFVEDEAVAVYLIPQQGRLAPLWQVVAPQRLMSNTRNIRIEKNQHLEVRLVDRESVEFFLDEDPVTTHGRLSLGVAGSVAFIPGPDYKSATK